MKLKFIKINIFSPRKKLPFLNKNMDLFCLHLLAKINLHKAKMT